MTSTAYCPSSRHSTSKYGDYHSPSSSSSNSGSTNLFLSKYNLSKYSYPSSPSSSSSSSSSVSSLASSGLRTRSSYDLTSSYRPSSYSSSSSPSSSTTANSYTSKYSVGGGSSGGSSYLTSKYSPGSSYSTAVTLTRFNQRRASFDYDHADSPSSTSSTSSKQQAKVPVAGLTNLGNTCYMNSVLQALYATKQLRDFLVNSYESGGQLYSALSRLFKDMQSSVRSGYTNPTSFRSTFISFEPKFRGYEQQDAQEFLRYLINGLHDECNKAKNRIKRQMIEPKSSQEAWNQYRDRLDDSKLIELFVGQFSSVIQCSDCRNESSCWDPFWDLSLAVPSYRSRVDINECLAAFTESETLDGNEQPFCSRCKKHRRSTKRLSIVRFPQVLIIHLKKFSNNGYKLSSDITVNQNLNIDGKQYELYACVCHHGISSRSGHYTAYVQYDGRWYHMNDEHGKEVTDSFSMATLKDAYVLFYRLTSSSSSIGDSSSSSPSSLGNSLSSSRYSSRL